MRFVFTAKTYWMRRKVAVVAGGDSGEYEISVKSAGVVIRNLDPSLFETYLILVRGNDWACRIDGTDYFVSKDDFSLALPGGKVRFDGVFNAIHGTPGEDGKIQGYLDLLGIPYSSCDQATSAITFNKFFCNHYVKSFGVNIARSLVLHQGHSMTAEEILRTLKLPVFVKPNRGGSSVGTSKVKTPEELPPALAKAFREDTQAMIEEYIPGREIACGVVFSKGKPITLPLTEIISHNEFFDYEAKYQGKSDEVTPANLDEAIARRCRELSLDLYHYLDCRGIVRFDYIVSGNELFFLEVNTIPGFSELSIVPQQALKAGIGLKDLFTEAMLNALDNPPTSLRPRRDG